ncbi:hypothetical protein KAI46_10785 [bacterium]|nr:hypothetical protein [bacterium]
MSPSQARTYSRNYSQHTADTDAADFLELIQQISVLTKIGAVCLVMGKFFGIMAIPAAFIPALNILVFPLIVMWGGFVILSIVLCSVDHFRKKKLADNAEAAPQLQHELEKQVSDAPAIIIPLAVGQN